MLSFVASPRRVAESKQSARTFRDQFDGNRPLTMKGSGRGIDANASHDDLKARQKRGVYANP
jgi:hypothetical protein